MKLTTLLLAVAALAATQTAHVPVPGPYRANANAHKDLAAAQARARAGHKYVMVIFGANWCEDCRVLHHSLESPEVRGYVASHFEIVGVDIGDDGKKNEDVARSLGVTLAKGVPAAVILNPDGTTLGRTNNGELEPSRNYQPQQILHFLEGIVEHQQITRPS